MLRSSVRAAGAACATAFFLLFTLAAKATDRTDPMPSAHRRGDGAFVSRIGSDLYWRGRPFRFVGSNNYYPIYKSQFMVDALFDTAAANDFSVMRVWGAIDIGNQDGSNSIDGAGKKQDIYFQYWDGSSPAYNDGADGLQKLDYVVYTAQRKGIKLVIPFINNWNAFGGMDQYVRWRNGTYHDDFYTDQTIRQWYKDWIAHVLNRVNTFTGVRYKDDPTIMAWELANEPRCTSAGVYPRSNTCTTETLTRWAAEMSAHIKSIDRNHLVSMGDEGFYCSAGSTDWTENCNEGVDTVAFASLKHVDLMSLHLYPDSWGKDASWGTEWIQRHIRDANRIGKPVMLGEFGLQDKNRRNAVYKEWTDTFLRLRGDGALFWILSDKQDDGTLYPDYDQFTVYCPSPVCSALGNFSKELRVGLPLPFKPIADDDRIETAFDTPAAIDPLQNDFAYWPLILLPGSIDLDPTSAGQQTTVMLPSGMFALQPDYSVAFTPTSGFVGEAIAPYTVRDNAHRSSNEANLYVTVRPNPGAGLTLFSFEDGTDGWHSINNLAANVVQSNQHATLGTASLQIAVGSAGDWFGTNLSQPLDLSTKTRLLIDLTLVGAGQGHNVALQTGSGWTWCEGSSWINADANSSTTLEIDLTAMSCRADQNDVKAIWLFLGDNRTYYIDNVRAE